jgi:aspartate-semialdehyde dehydrogenase
MTPRAPSPLHDLTLAVVGASGLVGREALAILRERGVPEGRIRPFGSARSAGLEIPYGGGAPLVVSPLEPAALAACDLALFCADVETARRAIPEAVASGVRVVDNSSAFRLAPDVPLVIPEINGDVLAEAPPLVANPNCSTILLLLAVEPIGRVFGLDSVLVSTYQAVSGAGRAAVDELFEQTRAALDGREEVPSVFPVPSAFNVFPHESTVDPATGLNGEEAKIVAESRKILGLPRLEIAPTCVRVPVERCHSQSVTVFVERPATHSALEDALRQASGVELHADPEALVTPRDLAGGDLLAISRVRLSRDGRRISFWTCGDQLRKGAALNAVQIAEELSKEVGWAERSRRTTRGSGSG